MWAHEDNSRDRARYENGINYAAVDKLKYLINERSMFKYKRY